MGLPVIRLTLYGISGKEKAVYEFEPDFLASDGVKPLVIDPRPVFTVTRIVLGPDVSEREVPEGVSSQARLFASRSETSEGSS